jgi:hypothetical protein
MKLIAAGEGYAPDSWQAGLSVDVFFAKTYYQIRMIHWNEGDALYQPKYEHE